MLKPPPPTFPHPTGLAEPPPAQHRTSPGHHTGVQTLKGWRDPPSRAFRAVAPFKASRAGCLWPHHIHQANPRDAHPKTGTASPRWIFCSPTLPSALLQMPAAFLYCCHVMDLIKILLEARIKLPLPISSLSLALFTYLENSSRSERLTSPRRQHCSSQSDYPYPIDLHLSDLCKALT